MLFYSYPDIRITTHRPIRTIIRSIHLAPLKSWQNFWPWAGRSNCRPLRFYVHLVASPCRTAIHCERPKVNVALKSCIIIWNTNQLKHRNLITSCCAGKICSLFVVPAKNPRNSYQIDSISRRLKRNRKVLPYIIIQIIDIRMRMFENHNPQSYRIPITALIDRCIATYGSTNILVLKPSPHYPGLFNQFNVIGRCIIFY